MSIDVGHQEEDGSRQVTAPPHAISGARGTVGTMFDVAAIWRKEASDVSAGSLPCGHLIPEEDPDGLLAASLRVLA